MDFFETFGPFLFHDLLWPAGMADIKEEFEKQWCLLRSAVLFVMRYHEGQHTPERVAMARQQFADYAARVERVRSSTPAWRYAPGWVGNHRAALTQHCLSVTVSAIWHL
jgi:hypothetical protein